MKIAISLDDNKGMDSQVSSIFGRCANYMLIDSESKEFSIEENPAKTASGGAGIQAAQWVVNQGIEAVISGNLGPKAYDVLSAGGVAAYKHKGESVQATIDAFNNKDLECLLAPTAAAHNGLK